MMRLHHIGIATENISESINKFQKIFDVDSVSKIVFDDKQNAELCMMTLKDNSRIEFIQGKVVESLLRKKIYLYHICYETECFEDMINLFVEQGAIIISEPKEAVLFDNKKVAFLMTEMGMMELLEK